MKRKQISLITAAIVAVLAVASAPQIYASEAVTRAEFCAYAVTFYEDVTGEEIAGRVGFADSKELNVEKAAAIGVAAGVGNNRFSPESKLTREQAAVMIVRLAEAVERQIPKKASTFSDNGSISPWAIDSVGRVQAAGIMNGTGQNNFSPRGSYTHEQTAVTMLRLYDFISSHEIHEQNTTPLEAFMVREETHDTGGYVERVLELINAERAKVGLPALIGTEPLHAAASVRAGELPLSFSHYRPDGSICFTVLDEFSIVSYTRGENIAGNFRSPEQVVEAWMNSPSHRKYILSPDYTNLGVGLYTDSSGKLYWSLFFIG